MATFPFTAVVGSDDMALALVLTTVAPGIGGVLVRGEKGTAKSTLVRALAEILPPQPVVAGCRFGCDPGDPDPACPDLARHTGEEIVRRPPLVELPVGAGEDRVTGALDLSAALSEGRAAFEPGLLAAANRGLLYVDEVNLLPDHLVDVLLDAAAMGRNTVEREGVSVSHAARAVLVGTMNPEEGELRPQLLDRFGLTVEVAASRDPRLRAEIVRRRLAYDDDPAAFADRYADAQRILSDRLVAAQAALPRVELGDDALTAIAHVCAGFDVDGMRADIVTARAAVAHAAWCGRERVGRTDVRTAALFALPHRRRRNPFDAPGIDEDLLDRLLDECDFDDPGPDTPDPQSPAPGDGPAEGTGDGEESSPPDRPAAEGDDRPESSRAESDSDSAPGTDGPAPADAPSQVDSADDDADEDTDNADSNNDAGRARAGFAPRGVSSVDKPFRTRTFTVHGLGRGADGRRSPARTSRGRTIGAVRGDHGPVHLTATIRAAAVAADPSTHGRLRPGPDHLRRQVNLGRESNLVLFVVDASGSMGARTRMSAVKTTILSMLLDAYQRRDQVGLITFRGAGAELVLPPTGSVEAAAARLRDLPHGGRTPLAQGLELAATTLRTAARRDPRRRPLVVLLTDGRATAGRDALADARRIADRWHGRGWQTLVLDCESGRMRLGLAADLARRMGAIHVPLEEVAADRLRAVIDRTSAHQSRRSA